MGTAEYVRTHGARMKQEVRLSVGDCLDKLKTLPDACVDLLCTDPPYGLTSMDPKRAGGGKGSAGFMGKKWDKAVPPVAVWKECLRVLKPGAFAFISCAARQDCQARMIMNLEAAGFVTGFTPLYWIRGTGFPKAQNLSVAADRRAGAKREVVGNSSSPNGRTYTGPRYKEKRQTKFSVVQDQPNKTAPATEEAILLSGSYAGWQPKPSAEPILVVMRPLAQKTYLDQALDNGKGCTWLDDCRIPIVDSSGATKSQFTSVGSDPRTHSVREDTAKGRFPANVVVQDDALGAVKTKSHGGGKASFGGYFGSGASVTDEAAMSRFAGDAGSFSRYFDLDAWFVDRIGELPEDAQRVFPNLLIPKASAREKNAGLAHLPKKKKPQPNHHPTVKPVKLLSYLVVLGSRENDVVLDPYMGSGTTGMAAIGQNRAFIGCDLDPEYVEIAKQRIKFVQDFGLAAVHTAKPKSKTKPKKGLW